MSDRHAPPPARGSSAARITDAFYVACTSDGLDRAPRAVTLLGTPMVLFRTRDGRPAALLDRCAHRNVPLSCGRARGDAIECPYHGWRFDRDGRCVAVPGLASADDVRRGAEGRRVPSFATAEVDGLVFVYGAPDVAPTSPPRRPRLATTSGYEHLRQETRFPASLIATAENALDVLHTAFLHRGLFRSGKRRTITAELRRGPDRVEVEYRGEPAPSGLLGRLLAPSGGEVTHVDRFIAPGITEVEYSLGGSHVLLTGYLTPHTDHETTMFGFASFRLPLPAGVVLPIVRPLIARIFAQDAEILRAQTESLIRSGGEAYASTELDFIGPEARRILRAREAGAAVQGELEVVRTVQLTV